MKKILAVLLVLCVLLGFSACMQKKNKLFEIKYQTYAPVGVEFVTEKEKYSTKDTVIRYSVTNITDKEQAIAGDENCFTLEKLVDGEWMWVGTKIDHGWNALAMILPPGQTETREIDLNEYFHLPLEEGEYRIVMEGMYSNSFTVD